MAKLHDKFFNRVIEGQLEIDNADSIDKSLVINAISGQAITPASINASGDITGNSIIENMEGYSFSHDSGDAVVTDIYAGVVKNGNKITFVAVQSITRTADTPANPYVGHFAIPESIGEKLFSMPAPLSGALDLKITPFYKSKNDTPVQMRTEITKRSDTKISFGFYGTTSLTLDETYFYRVEATFLLSDNLAPQP